MLQNNSLFSIEFPSSKKCIKCGITESRKWTRNQCANCVNKKGREYQKKWRSSRSTTRYCPVCKINVIEGHNQVCSNCKVSDNLIFMPEIQRRFFDKISPMMDDRNCWEWFGCLNDDGYGHMGILGKTIAAHRMSYEIHIGPIPEDVEVCHKCDNPPCVNPNHLFLGTHQENIIDMFKKGRANSIGIVKAREVSLANHRAQTHCKYGHPFSDENTYFQKSKNKRCCKICRRRRADKYLERKIACGL